MSEYDWTHSLVVVCGLKGSGKTTMARPLARQVAPDRLALYDPQREFAGGEFSASERHEPEKVMSRTEFEGWFGELLPPDGRDTSDYDAIIVDEANLYIPARYPLSEAVGAYTNMGRHIRTSLVCVTRRPVQLYVDVIELADYLIVYKLAGSNDISKLNSISAGLGIEVSRLPPYHYAVVRDGAYTLHSPLEDDNVRRNEKRARRAGDGRRQRGWRRTRG